ncbi:hypothetical protein L0F63_005678 [Massospora cicadina]|nr:hypothetical protein L0F63_005678 [Massospora cicadina]
MPFNDEVKEEPEKPSSDPGSSGDIDRELRIILKKLDDQYDVSAEEHQMNFVARGKLAKLHSKNSSGSNMKLTHFNIASPNDVSLLDALSGVQQKLAKLDKALGGISNNPQTEAGAKLLSKLGHAQALLENVDHSEFVARLPELALFKEVSHAFELETRIKSLEQLLGSEMSRPADVPEFKNFGGNLARVHELMRLLADPNQLDYVLQRVKLVNAELEHLCEIQEGLASEGQLLYYDEEPELNKQVSIINGLKVDQLMELFDRLEPLVQQAPMLTSRLKTMGSFHNEALDMVLILGKLDGLVKAAEDDANSALDKCRRNTKHVEDRLTSLAARLEKLKASA